MDSDPNGQRIEWTANGIGRGSEGQRTESEAETEAEAEAEAECEAAAKAEFEVEAETKQISNIRNSPRVVSERARERFGMYKNRVRNYCNWVTLAYILTLG